MGDYLFADKFVLESNQTRDFYHEYLKGLVHKTNNVIGVIHGFSGLALMEENLDTSVKESLEQIDTAARQMTELNKNILTTGGCGKVDLEAVSLSEFGPFLESKVGEICRANEVKSSFSMADNLPKIHSDKSRLTEVIEALTMNAAEGAAEHKGDVSVKFDLLGNDQVEMLFQNTFSREITDEKVYQFYEPFFSSRGNNHFGMGLTRAAVLAGQLESQLGIKVEDNLFTACVRIPITA